MEHEDYRAYRKAFHRQPISGIFLLHVKHLCLTNYIFGMELSPLQWKLIPYLITGEDHKGLLIVCILKELFCNYLHFKQGTRKNM